MRTRGDGVDGSSLQTHCGGLVVKEAVTTLKTLCGVCVV